MVCQVDTAAAVAVAVAVAVAAAVAAIRHPSRASASAALTHRPTQALKAVKAPAQQP